jgi:hypothetical protein
MGNTAEATRLSTPLVSGGSDEATSIFQRANQILQITYNRIAQAHTKKTSQNSPFAESAIQRAELGIQLARFSGNVADELDLQTNRLMSLSLRAPQSGRPGVRFAGAHCTGSRTPWPCKSPYRPDQLQFTDAPHHGRAGGRDK